VKQEKTSAEVKREIYGQRSSPSIGKFGDSLGKDTEDQIHSNDAILENGVSGRKTGDEVKGPEHEKRQDEGHKSYGHFRSEAKYVECPIKIVFDLLDGSVHKSTEDVNKSGMGTSVGSTSKANGTSPSIANQGGMRSPTIGSPRQTTRQITTVRYRQLRFSI